MRGRRPGLRGGAAGPGPRPARGQADPRLPNAGQPHRSACPARGRRRWPDAPGHAAPAQASDLFGLPPVYFEVGELGISRNEDLACARRVAATGTPVELHTRPGYPHVFDDRAPQIDVTHRARADPLRTLTSC
ncbi:alpha/beta hydrolase fold domain-containing protein [Streptomyces mirabilis]|uniref:alpha/beta hydrolase fold domain-containing protein n=1 Tax=Streptomyces mirabilis TaxID=68239 RepID=UPI0036E13F58